MSDDEIEVRKVISDFAGCWNQHDVGALAALFARDAEFVNVVGLWWKGREQITLAHDFTHSTIFRQSRLDFDGVAVRFPVWNLAIARARWTLRGHVSPDGAPLPARNGILCCVLVRDATSWSIVDAQNTDVVEGEVSRPQ